MRKSTLFTTRLLGSGCDEQTYKNMVMRKYFISLAAVFTLFTLVSCQAETPTERVNPIEFGVGPDEGNKLNLEELLNMDGAEVASEISNSLNYLEQFDISDFNPELPSELGLNLGETIQIVESKIFRFLRPKESEKADVQLGVDVKPFDTKTILLATKLGVDDPVISGQQILVEFDVSGKMTGGGIRYNCLRNKEPNNWVKKC